MVMRGRRDMRNPYGSRGGYVSSRRPRRDRAMGDYGYDFPRNPEQDFARGGMRRGGRDYADYNDYGMDYADYEHDMRGGDYGTYALSGEYDGRMMDYGDYGRGRRMDYGYEDMRRGDYGYDMARSGRGRGRGRGRDYGDYADYGDYGDYGDEEIKLSKHDMEKWKKQLHNADGSKGEHFRKEQIEQMAKQWGTDVNKYGGADVFAMTMNMMYSDYCGVAKKYGVDRPEYYAELSKAFLDDKDFEGEGAEKLALYYKCIVEKDED